MNKKEFAIFVSGLRAYYPRENILPSTDALELWFRQLEDIPYKVAETVLHRWVATNRWSPTIADIREGAAELTTEPIPDWGEAWGQVMRAVSLYGSYEPEKAYELMGEPTATCVKRIGWKEICFAESLDNVRANFRMMYENEAKRKTRERQIPGRLAKLTAGVIKGIEVDD